MSKPELFKFDSRVRERMLRSGALSRAEVDEHIQGLPDLDGEFELLSDIPQPAVSPAKPETYEEPILFDGGRGFQSIAEAPSGAPSRELPPVSPGASENLRSALTSTLENEISGVGVGAVSAALGAMAAESGGFPVGLAQSPFASALGMAAAASEAEARGQEPVLMPQSPFANALGVAAEVAAASAAAEAAAAAAAAGQSQAPTTLRSEDSTGEPPAPQYEPSAPVYTPPEQQAPSPFSASSDTPAATPEAAAAPAAEEPRTEEAVSEEPASEEAVSEEAVSEEPRAEEPPAVEAAGSDTSAEERPAEHVPSSEAPSSDGADADERPAQEDDGR